jgi:hypothetical protein
VCTSIIIYNPASPVNKENAPSNGFLPFDFVIHVPHISSAVADETMESTTLTPTRDPAQKAGTPHLDLEIWESTTPNSPHSTHHKPPPFS